MIKSILVEVIMGCGGGAVRLRGKNRDRERGVLGTWTQFPLETTGALGDWAGRQERQSRSQITEGIRRARTVGRRGIGDSMKMLICKNLRLYAQWEQDALGAWSSETRHSQPRSVLGLSRCDDTQPGLEESV